MTPEQEQRMAERALGRHAAIAQTAAGIIGDIASRGKNPLRCNM